MSELFEIIKGICDIHHEQILKEYNMTQAKHTPGQWTALVHAAIEKGAAHPAYKANLLKEARIADAAPELLEALEHTRHAIELNKADMKGGVYGYLCQITETAIAKARGQA